MTLKGMIQSKCWNKQSRPYSCTRHWQYAEQSCDFSWQRRQCWRGVNRPANTGFHISGWKNFERRIELCSSLKLPRVVFVQCDVVNVNRSAIQQSFHVNDFRFSSKSEKVFGFSMFGLSRVNQLSQLSWWILCPWCAAGPRTKAVFNKKRRVFRVSSNLFFCSILKAGKKDRYFT